MTARCPAARRTSTARSAPASRPPRKGNITYLDGIASIRNYVKGAFAGLAGPWVKGVNYLSVQAVEMEPFKTLLAAIIPTNNSEGAKPTINTVLDETTLVYDVITGTDVFSIAGSDLAPDTTKDDEYVALVDAHGVETKAIIDFSDLQNVKAHLESGLLAGEYTLKVYTRSGGRGIRRPRGLAESGCGVVVSELETTMTKSRTTCFVERTLNSVDGPQKPWPFKARPKD